MTLLSANKTYLNEAIKKQLIENTLVREEDYHLHFSSSKHNGAKLLELARYNLVSVIDKLEQIDLSFLPSFEGLEQLSQLREVRFFDNKLKQLPPQLFHLKNLERLYIRINPLLDFEQLCLDLTHFKALKGLYLENNALERVPLNLEQLSHLEVLRFNNRQLRSSNSIQKIPAFLLSFKQLKELHFEKNPVNNIPKNLFSFAQKQLKAFTLGAYPFRSGSEAKAYLNLFKIHGLSSSLED